MDSGAGRFGELKLLGMPFEIDPASDARIRAAAAELEADATPEWESEPGQLAATITLVDSRDDGLALTLVVADDGPTRLEVAAAVEVDCWCVKNHGLHQVERHEWLVGTPDALADGFVAAVRQVTRWLASAPRDTAPWRERAGLPGPQP
ncbi:hypothetical protein [Asanoa siamensis]|uniref:Uncharacterized protein n=1 Tax=Asanoa siamensis TaxID=926357 RepID=A0ABQ4CMH8_9ACTN|nr:hypothetical protein [Asanoa siamensis]GIF72490.1 hypothetical protein Asi02nite_20080 [Asanoa siamensis]